MTNLTHPRRIWAQLPSRSRAERRRISTALVVLVLAAEIALLVVVNYYAR